MTIAIQPAAARPAIAEADQLVVMENVSWGYYERTLAELGEHNRLRITFDRGRMQIMAPSSFHERSKTLIGRLIEAYAHERRMPLIGAGSFTCRREDLARGLEPDECYYVTTTLNCPLEREIDLSVDPPPDLAIEVDITRSSIAREPVYAALGVPEIWRFDGHRVTALRREPNGEYSQIESSLCFPELPMSEFNRFLHLAMTSDQSEAVRAFCDWARGQAG